MSRQITVEVVKFHPKHLELIQMRVLETESIFHGDAYDRMDKAAKESVQAGTFLYDGRVLFCAGFSQLWPGVLEIWMIPSVHIKSAPFLVAKTVKRYIDAIARDFKAHRIQTTTYADAAHTRWMEFLGFKCEGTLEKYTHDKKSMLVFARVF